MRYTLRQLQVFLATAQTENISKAAQTLAMSQSAASTALKELESQFDVQLFDRVGKRLQLNELGKSLRPNVEGLMAQADELEQALKSHKAMGSLKVGATLTIGNYLAVDIIAAFKQRFDQAELSLHVANTQQIAEQLLNFDLDVALVEGEINHPDLTILPWMHDELCVFCAPENPYAQLSRLNSSLKDRALVKAQWIVREPGSGTRQAFDRAMQGILSDLSIALELEHTEAIKRAVLSNLGLGCLSKIAVADGLQRGQFVQLKLDERNLKRQFYLVYHKKKYHGEALKQFIVQCEKFSENY